MAQSALAMLARSILLANAYELEHPDEFKHPSDKEALTAQSLYGFQTDDVALRGDEHFATRLARHPCREARKLATKLAERRLFRPLLVIPGHRASALINGASQRHNEQDYDNSLRELAAILDSRAFAPFIHVVSAAIEALLRHEFSDIDLESPSTSPYSLAGFLRSFATSERARTVPPSHRVLFWTLPYKQLFKDPAIVVTFRSIARRLDELNRLDENRVPSTDRAEFDFIRARVDSGIHDADIRYSQLWKVYVFLSDGLFYSGSIAKLIRDDSDYARGCADGTRDAHSNHLKLAVTIASRAITAAWKHWVSEKGAFSRARAEGTQIDPTKAVEKLLGNDPSDRMMEDLVHSLLTSQDSCEGISEVSVEQYQHSEGSTYFQCRDVRYRFEESGPPSQFQDFFSSVQCDRVFFPSEVSDIADGLRLPNQEFAGELSQLKTPSDVALAIRKRAIDCRLATYGTSALFEFLSSAHSSPVEATFTRIPSASTHSQGTLWDGGSSASTGVASVLDHAEACYRRGDYDAAKGLLAAIETATPTSLRASVMVLLAKLALEENALAEAARLICAARECLDSADEPTIAEVARLHRVVSWRTRYREFVSRHATKRITPIPKEIGSAMEREPTDRQERFLHLAEEQLGPSSRAFSRSFFTQDTWRKVVENFTQERF
jgi:hypothetical protein